MTEEQVDRMISDNEAIVVGCTYNIMFTNDLVCGAVVEALAGLRKSAMCRHETKKEAGRVEKERKDYERMVNGVVRRSADFFADANDAFTGEVAKHVEVLYWSIKDELDKFQSTHPRRVRPLCFTSLIFIYLNYVFRELLLFII